MPALHAPPARPWFALLRALAGALVLAGALSTGAGGVGNTVRPAADAAPARPAPAGVQATGPAASLPPEGAAAHATGGAGAFGPRPTLTTPPTPTARPGDPPPYAPGGDDLLSVAEPAAPLQRAAPATGAPVAAARPPAPRLWLERSQVGLGEVAVLHVATAPVATTSGSLPCWGTGALAGLLITSTRIELRASTAGQHRLAVACGQPGAAAEAAVLLTVPLPVAATSGQNRQPLDSHTARLPLGQLLRQLGLRPLGGAEDAEPALIALGDFLQQGRQSVFTVAAGPDGSPWAHVLAQDAAGRWADRSADVLDAAQRGVCARPVQTLSVDFNRDGRPDVWLACEGRQQLFLSQADGRYRRIDTPFVLQARQAEARDVDGDGWPDTVLQEASTGTARTWLLLGRGDGHFELGPAQAWGLARP